MGRGTFTRDAYETTRKRVASDSSRTEAAEKQFQENKEMDPMVDPKGGHLIRPSRLRFDELADGRFQMTVGTSMPVELRLDTTGSMGTNVDIAFDVLPQIFDLLRDGVLSRYDVHIATGIFNDIRDTFPDGSPGVVSCRSQFEMTGKIAEQMTQMVPMRHGRDVPEDPHYGLFGATYLTEFYANKIGLKGYDFTISDAPAHTSLLEHQLTRIYGDDVFDKVAENGHQIDRNNLPTNPEMVQDLLTRTHAFFLQIGENSGVSDHWADIMGEDRVIVLPQTKLLPQVMAAIIGLTEGVLNLQSINEFLAENGVGSDDAQKIARSVAGIPIGAQAALPNFNKIPQAGDIFETKTELWPVEKASEGGLPLAPVVEESGAWL